ncbi:dehydrogenase [Actinomycetota bacterium]|nr:dehydrogenase [Actinomycetota bacterium]
MSKEISRRSFVKVGATGAALAGVGATGAFNFGNWFEKAHADDNNEEKVAYLCHQFHCLGGCCIKATVRGGRLVLIEPNDAIDKDDQHICLRGIAEVQHVYSTDRIQTPLKRVGERGDGEFVAISWEEAIKTIADAIKESQAKYGDSSFFFRKSTEASVAHGFEFLPQFLHADTGGKWGLDRGQANGFVPAYGPNSYSPPTSFDQMLKASTIINLGINTLESGIVWARVLLDAKAGGTKLITIDPRYTATASKSHQWIPVKPGTDPALVLGMIGTILESKWYDTEFMLSNTSFPFLVNADTGVLLGGFETRVDEATKASSEVKIPMIWDSTTNMAVRFDAAGAKPALEGTWNIDGQNVTTTFALLVKQNSTYTADWASGVTGIEAEIIRKLASDYANNGPAIINFGLGGPDKYTNADVLGHAIAVVTALTGNYGREGTGAGWYGSGAAFHSGKKGAWTLPAQFKTGDTGLAMYDMPYKENNVHVALTFGDAFTLESGNANKMLDWVKSLDFFAICDIYNSSAVAYADIVLPACSKFESEEEVGPLRDSKNYIAITQKSIDPLFECKTDLQIERLLAAEWGYDQYLPKTYEELAKKILTGTGPNMEGITFDSLMQNQGVKRIVGSEVPLPPNFAQEYKTPSTKIEVYYENQVDDKQAWPQYEQPDEVYAENPIRENYPMVFMQGKTRFRIHAYYSAASWFREYYEPSVNISPADAAARGIATGDDVEVTNDRGAFIAKALINRGIQDGTLFMAETTYSQYYKKGFLQNVTNSARNQRCYAMTYGPQIPYNDTLVEIKKVSVSGGGKQ